MDRTASLVVRTTQRLAGGFVAAPDLDVTLPAGSLLVLFGPSGAGKTTILRQISGLERPDTGVIRMRDTAWFDGERGVWVAPQERRVGVVFQAPTLFPHLSVRDNVAYGAGGMADRAGSLSGMLGLDALLSRRPRELSGGEAQRVALARALARDPVLLLLDEPFASLDAPTRTRLRRDVRALLTAIGTPAILVTHDRAEAMAMGDRIAVVTGGRIRQTGPIAQVFSHPADADTAAALGVETVLPATVAGIENGLLSVAVGRAALHVPDRDGVEVGAQVFACIRAEDVMISSEPPAHASARNHLAARVVSITPEGPLDRVALDCGFMLDALITRQSRADLGLSPGVAVTAAIKASSVHLVARDA